jgi:hypothetical protein
VIRAAALVLTVALSVPLAGAGRLVVRYEQDRLTLEVERTPVADVLAELARQSGAEVRGEVASAGEVTLSYERLPLPEALHRLVGAQNFALIYGEHGRLRVIEFLGAAKAKVAQPVRAGPVSPAPAAPGDDPILALLNGHGPFPVSGALAAALGTEQASFSQLLDTLLRGDDPGLRAEAARVAVEGLDADAALAGAVAQRLVTVDDDALSAMLRGAAGDRAAEIARQVAAHASTPALRSKAQAVLRRIHATD